MSSDLKIQKENPPEPDKCRHIKKEFEAFILAKDHPCMMAQSVFSQEHVDFHTYKRFGSREAASEILTDIRKYLTTYDFESPQFYTFIAAFEENRDWSEKEFEDLLWKQLQFLHDLDKQEWDDEVNKDPESHNFSFSLAGKAFYVVGMHPNSSRKARQSPYPALAFNLHYQFEKLREMKVFTAVRDKIRQRDIQLQGNRNPMLTDFGSSSEAKQYSGRKVDENWKCPFHHK